MWKSVWCVVVVGVICAGVANGAPSVPDLQAAREKKKDAVRVKWAWSGDAKRTTTVLELERSTDGEHYAALTDVERARKRASYVDKSSGAGAYWYRARVIADGVASGWSAPAAVAGTSTPSGPTSPESGGCPSGSVTAVLDLVNEVRHSVGMPALRNDARLAAAAQARSAQMAAEGKLTHDGAWETIRAAGYTGGALGENIAYGYPNAASVVAGWVDSAGHLGNLLRSIYRDSGVGCVRDGRGRLWWTHDFGG